jgi:hypothetical protein
MHMLLDNFTNMVVMKILQNNTIMKHLTISMAQVIKLHETMSPREKADYLIQKYKDIQYPDFTSEQQAKKGASLLCDEMMDANINLDGEHPKRYMEMVHDFYYNVKREING